MWMSELVSLSSLALCYSILRLPPPWGALVSQTNTSHATASLAALIYLPDMCFLVCFLSPLKTRWYWAVSAALLSSHQMNQSFWRALLPSLVQSLFPLQSMPGLYERVSAFPSIYQVKNSSCKVDLLDTESWLANKQWMNNAKCLPTSSSCLFCLLKPSMELLLAYVKS